jgi:hypothetical protein
MTTMNHQLQEPESVSDVARAIQILFLDQWAWHDCGGPGRPDGVELTYEINDHKLGVSIIVANTSTLRTLEYPPQKESGFTELVWLSKSELELIGIMRRTRRGPYSDLVAVRPEPGGENKPDDLDQDDDDDQDDDGPDDDSGSDGFTANGPRVSAPLEN